MEKQHIEQSSLNAEKALYKKFFIVMVLTGGMIGGWVFVLVFLGVVGLIDKTVFNIGEIVNSLFSFGSWGWLLGMPAAWLTARSVRKRGLRRNRQGCLKTAAWGAWWSVATIGMLLSIGFFMPFILFGGEGAPKWAQTDWYRQGIILSCIILMLALSGLILAGVLSLLLPKPEAQCLNVVSANEEKEL